MDLQILQWINNNLHGSGFINQVFKYITYLGEKGIVWIILAVVLLCFKKTRRGGFLLLISLGVGIILNTYILKPLIARPRPITADESFIAFMNSINYEIPTSYSMPSGHTQIAINAAMLLTLQFKGKGAWAWLPAGLISLSRVFLLAHYPTDVLVAAIEGIIIALLVYFVGGLILDKIIAAYNNRKNENNVNKETKEEPAQTKGE